MENIREHLEDISEIRSLMERNSKFLSLSGLSGVSAGICGLGGALAAWQYLEYSFADFRPHYIPADIVPFFFLTSLLTLGAALGLALLFSVRMAKRRELPMWNKTARRTLLDLCLPLLVGGLFCLIMVGNGHYLYVGAATLLFYGMALLNASRNTLPEIRYLAFSECVLGLACALMVSHSLLFWALGFGVLHIVYGAVMYFKYER